MARLTRPRLGAGRGSGVDTITMGLGLHPPGPPLEQRCHIRGTAIVTIF